MAASGESKDQGQGLVLPSCVWSCLGPGSPDGSDGKETACNGGDPDLIPGS